MHPDFSDITERIEEKPSWYSEGGIPRYGKPQATEHSIYADESIAVVIGCQGCQEEFLVVYDAHKYDTKYVCVGGPLEGGREWQKENIWKMEMVYCSLVRDAKAGNVPHYGDPPRHGCVGDTMNSFAIRTWVIGINLPRPQWVEIATILFRVIGPVGLIGPRI